MKKLLSPPSGLSLRLLAAAALTLALASCGGGGGGGSSTPATPETPVTTPDTAGGTTTTTDSGTGGTTTTTTSPAGTVALTMSPPSVLAGKTSTLSWSTANVDTCEASGAWSGAQATSGNLAISRAQAGSYTYSLTCTSAAGTVSSSATLTVTTPVSNVAALTVNSGPQGSSFNAPFVSVTICQPGSSVCKTVDNILVDTGSFGLRVFDTGVLNGTLPLPAVTNAAGRPVAECAQFVSGFTWGSVRRADVKIAGEVASNIPIEIIADSDSTYSTVPSACSSAGANVGSVAAMGANGILGVGLFKEDCGAACVQSTSPNYYFACANGSCTSTTLPLASQVSNPVPSFAYDNNGVLISLPAVASGGQSSLTGSLIFGVDTQDNNRLGSAAVFKADQSANFQTTYKGKTYYGSFIDSGSNGLYFPDATIAKCSASSNFYCPGSTLNLSATNAGYDGTNATVANFYLDDLRYLAGTTTAASIGGNPGMTSFDWGLPFFFGRPVFVVMDKASTSKGVGPFWAY